MIINKITVTAAILTHERPKKIKNMVYQMENQTERFDKIKIYASGYDEDEFTWCKHPVSHQPDKKDWGHAKRACALNECDTDYILCACDDDIYLYHFLEKMKERAQETLADFVYCNYRTNSNAMSNPYIDAKPESGFILSGCTLIKSDIVKKHPYVVREFMADSKWIENCYQSGASISKVDECLFFHY